MHRRRNDGALNTVMRADLIRHGMNFLVLFAVAFLPGLILRLVKPLESAVEISMEYVGDLPSLATKPALVIICTAALFAVFRWKKTRFVAKSLSDRVAGTLTGASAVVFGLAIGVCVSEIIRLCQNAGTAQPYEISLLLATSVKGLLLTAVTVSLTVFIGNFPILLHGKEADVTSQAARETGP